MKIASVPRDVVVMCFSSTETMWLERDFIRAVMPQLKNGIEHFKTVATILLAYDESQKQALQKVIVKGKQSLGLADSAATAQLSKVNTLTESLTARKGELDHQQTYKAKELENLKSECQSIADSMENFREALENAQRSLNSAHGTLEDLERKCWESETARNVGIGIMFIPFIGTIAGEILSKKIFLNASFSLCGISLFNTTETNN